MAIDNNVITLADYANQSNVPQVAMIANSVYNFGSVIRDWPLLTDPTLSARGVRLQNDGLPTVNWRKINEGTTVTKAQFNSFAEQAYILSNAIDTDVKLLQEKNQIGGPGSVLGQSIDAYIEAWSLDSNDKFFNNNHLTGDEDAPVGIRFRLDNPSTYGPISACKIDGGGVDLSDGNISAANSVKFQYYLDKMLDEMGVPEGDGTVIYMNRDLQRRLAMGAKLAGAGAGGFDATRDSFDRRVMTYRNAMIRTVGPKADGTTEVITSTETTAGVDGASSYTSVYAVRYGENLFQPWQFNEFGFQDIGIRSDEPTHYRVFIDWAVGFVQQNNRSIARIYNVKVA